jgi:hypothetical protein
MLAAMLSPVRMDIHPSFQRVHGRPSVCNGCNTSDETYGFRVQQDLSGVHCTTYVTSAVEVVQLSHIIFLPVLVDREMTAC